MFSKGHGSSFPPYRPEGAGPRGLRRKMSIPRPGLGLRGRAWRHIRHRGRALKTLLLTSKLNVLLAFVPLCFVAVAIEPRVGEEAAAALGLVAAMASLAPLAERLGFVTEALAEYTNDAIGGLLMASFGNATELIICIAALRKNELRVVQLSMLGSILSNLLLVLGTALAVGGTKHRRGQRFNPKGTVASVAMLFLGALTFLLCGQLGAPRPMPDQEDRLVGGEFSEWHELPDSLVLDVSRGASLCLLVSYGFFLLFQLKTHKHLFEDEKDGGEGEEEGPGVGGGDGDRPTVLAVESLELRGSSGSGSEEEEEERIREREGLLPLRVPGSVDPEVGAPRPRPGPAEPVPEIPLFDAVLWLTLITVLVAVLSDLVVKGIEKGASESLRIPTTFTTTILLPIIGNAAEHASAIVFAYKNRMEITMGIAIGSSTQIAIFVVPFCVLVAWALGEPLTLNFRPFETLSLMASVAIVYVIIQDGRSNWLKGAVLLLAYLILAIAFWVLPWTETGVDAGAEAALPVPVVLAAPPGDR